MNWLFFICAVLGSTVLVFQFVLTLVGIGSDLEIADDLPDDVPHDLGHGIPHDASHGPSSELGDNAVGHGEWSSWLFGVLTFKTVTAALAFFGLAGCAALSAGYGVAAQLTLAVLAGSGALFGVHWLMRSLYRLSEDGTIKLSRSVGKEGIVYLTVPAGRRGAGKVQFNLQNRLVEYEAVTDSEDPLPTGSRIRIVGVIGTSRVEVEPAIERKPSAAAAAV